MFRGEEVVKIRYVSGARAIPSPPMGRRVHLTDFSRERVNCQRNNGRRVWR